MTTSYVLQNLTLFINESDNTPLEQTCWDENPGHACFHIWRDFYFYALAIILPLGLIFNSMSLGVFATSWMRHTIPGRYFMALAVADNIVLTSELLIWLNTMDFDRGYKLGINFFHSIDAFCKFLYFLRYGSRIWSSWVTVSITIERFLTVTFPFKVTRLSSPAKVIVVVLSEAMVCFGVALFPFFTVTSSEWRGHKVCLIDSDTYVLYHYMVLVLMACIGELALPSLVMLCFTALIIRKLYQAHNRRLRMSSSDAKSQQKQLQPTIALVLIALTFIIIRLPYLIMFFINQFSRQIFPNVSQGGRLRIYAIFSVAKALAVTNYAINFLLFCMAGNTFREEVRKCCRYRRTEISRGHQQGSMTSTLTLRDKMTSHAGMKMTSYGSASVRGSHLQELAADTTTSESVSGTFLPNLDVSTKMAINGVDCDASW